MANRVIAYDAEFCDDGERITLISLGMVDLRGNELYRCSTDFDPQAMGDWLQTNVLPQLPSRSDPVWQSRAQIKDDILAFVGSDDPIWVVNSGAYDHVVLHQLWGPMVNIPKGWRYWSFELQQFKKALGNPEIPKQETSEHSAINDARENLRVYQYLLALQATRQALG